MFDTRRDRVADGFVAAQHATRAGLRYTALILVAVCLVVWICNRPWTKPFQPTAPLDRVAEVIVRAGLQPVGYFHEPATWLLGTEVSMKDCSQPVALLPAMIGDMELAPDELSYRDGDYQIAYAFDGSLYPESWISYRLEVIATWRRLTALFSRSESERLHYYTKIWTPIGCHGLTSDDVARLRDAD